MLKGSPLRHKFGASFACCKQSCDVLWRAVQVVHPLLGNVGLVGSLLSMVVSRRISADSEGGLTLLRYLLDQVGGGDVHSCQHSVNNT